MQLLGDYSTLKILLREVKVKDERSEMSFANGKEEEKRMMIGEGGQEIRIIATTKTIER